MSPHRFVPRAFLGLLAFAACSSSDPDPGMEDATSADATGEAGETETDGESEGSSADATSSSTEETGAESGTDTTEGGDTDTGTSTTDGGDTGVECPDNACTGPEAGADGYCEDGVTRVECVEGPDGCPVPGETITCEDECLLGSCCSDSFFSDDPECSCISNPCLDDGLSEGFHCLETGEVLQCSDSFGCMRPTNGTPSECEDGLTCDPSTGTCGGCDPSDPCFGMSEGFQLCASAPGINGATCALVDGCMTETNVVDCQKACMFGEGCCGGLGDSCCDAMTPSCFDGLSCVDDVCVSP